MEEVIVSFPDVDIDIKKHENNFVTYAQMLGVPIIGLSVQLARALAEEIERSQSLLGATIDVYADFARQLDPAYKDATDTEFLETLLGYFAPERLVYAIVLAEDDSIERILSDQQELYAHLKGSAWFEQDKLNRTLFVPSEHFTQKTWAFSYSPKDLENFVIEEV